MADLCRLIITRFLSVITNHLGEDGLVVPCEEGSLILRWRSFPTSYLSWETPDRNNCDTCCSPFFDKLWLSECRVLFPARVAWVGGFKKKKNDEKPTSQLIPATKRKTYLFSKIPNYERQNLAGRCALLSSSWLLFAWVYLPADIRNVTEIHFTTVTTSRPNPVTE